VGEPLIMATRRLCEAFDREFGLREVWRPDPASLNYETQDPALIYAAALS
jgi:hypothetical protein